MRALTIRNIKAEYPIEQLEMMGMPKLVSLVAETNSVRKS